MKTRYVLSALVAVAMTGAAQAQTSVKLGVLNDRSGVYSDLTGEGSVIAARMAVEDFKAPEKGKILINSGGGTSDLTGSQCSPNTVHWTYDTWALANGTGSAMVKRGGNSWYFLTADYAFGHALERDTAAVVTKSGGKVLGSVRHPLSATDFSSFLLSAQNSNAKVIGLANAGGDTVNAIKAAADFGIA